MSSKIKQTKHYRQGANAVIFSLMWRTSAITLPILVLFVILPVTPTTMIFKITTFIQMVTPNDTGFCDVEFTLTQDNCSIECFNRLWCVNFVYEPCNEGSQPYSCRCVMCYQKPALEENSSSSQVWGKIQTTPSTKLRLVEKTCSSLEDYLPWRNISANCIAALDSIETTLSPCEVKAFKLVDVVNDEEYFLEPVCPPSFVSRGHVVCNNSAGVWANQDKIACFPTTCQEFDDIGQPYYAGTLSVNEDGFPCASWTTEGAWVSLYLDNEYPFDNYNIEEAANYCRPFLDDDFLDIWCYNNDWVESDPRRERWAECDIPVCPDLY